MLETIILKRYATGNIVAMALSLHDEIHPVVCHETWIEFLRNSL